MPLIQEGTPESDRATTLYPSGPLGMFEMDAQPESTRADQDKASRSAEYSFCFIEAPFLVGLPHTGRIPDGSGRVLFVSGLPNEIRIILVVLRPRLGLRNL